MAPNTEAAPERLTIIGAGASVPAGLPTIDGFTAFLLTQANESLASEVAQFLASQPRINNIEDLFSKLAEGRNTAGLLRQLSEAVAGSFHKHYRRFLAAHYSAQVPQLGYGHEAPEFPEWPEMRRLESLQHAIGFRCARNLSNAVFTLLSDQQASPLHDQQARDSASLAAATEIAEFVARVCRRFNYYDVLASIFQPADAVINLNYDCLLEVAMEMKLAARGYRYVGIEPMGFYTCGHGHIWCDVGAEGAWLSKSDTVRVLKPHGSANWFECEDCLEPYAVPMQMTKRSLAREVRRSPSGQLWCGHSVKRLRRLLIPPFKCKTWQQNSHVSRSIRYAQENFGAVKSVVALGFSFSGADEHLREVLRTIPEEAEVTIVNPDMGYEFRQRCKSFFGGRGGIRFESEPTRWIVKKFLVSLKDKEQPWR